MLSKSSEIPASTIKVILNESKPNKNPANKIPEKDTIVSKIFTAKAFERNSFPFDWSFDISLTNKLFIPKSAMIENVATKENAKEYNPKLSTPNFFAKINTMIKENIF